MDRGNTEGVGERRRGSYLAYVVAMAVSVDTFVDGVVSISCQKLTVVINIIAGVKGGLASKALMTTLKSFFLEDRMIPSSGGLSWECSGIG